MQAIAAQILMKVILLLPSGGVVPPREGVGGVQPVRDTAAKSAPPPMCAASRTD